VRWEGVRAKKIASDEDFFGTCHRGLPSSSACSGKGDKMKRLGENFPNMIHGSGPLAVVFCFPEFAARQVRELNS